MKVFSSTLLAILLVGSMVYGDTHGATRRRRPVPIGKTRQGPSETGTAAKPLSQVKKRSSNGKGLDESFAANVPGRRKRQDFHDLSVDPSLLFFSHLSEHGTFNQDTSSCDAVMSRSCKSPSDCYGCLGLFTCKMPQGRCDFKGVSRRTGIFFQILQDDEDSDRSAH